MEKLKADRIITEYLKKIYGFAFKKAFSYDEADELASLMTAEIYTSLLSADDVYNVDGYVWRLCENVYSRYVSKVKRNEGVSIDDLDIPFYDDIESGWDDEEMNVIRREIAFLSSSRREIVFRFYYKSEPIKKIAEELSLPEGTVKWHLNKARNELKEGFKMERKIGKLGLHPVKSTCIGHGGNPGNNGGPEYYLGDKLNLNIVYSVYFEPKTATEIAEELGVTPVFIEDKIAMLESNGFLVRTKGDKFTTYVDFSPTTYSREQKDNKLKKKYEAALLLVEKYVPLVRKALEKVNDVYIPSGNRELFEAAMIFDAVSCKCRLKKFDTADVFNMDRSKYIIKTTDGGSYIAFVDLSQECSDPEYKMTMTGNYSYCGCMTRQSEKYKSVLSRSYDSRYDSREGYWENNKGSDYDYIYEYITGQIDGRSSDEEKIKRLHERKFLSDDGKINITIVKSKWEDVWALIPELDENIQEKFAKFALDDAMLEAKKYPPQMQDLVISDASNFISSGVAMMVLDILYKNGTFRPLTEEEKVTANLVMYSDVLPS